MNGEHDTNEAGSAAKLPSSLIEKVARAIGTSWGRGDKTAISPVTLGSARAAIAVVLREMILTINLSSHRYEVGEFIDEYARENGIEL